MIISLNPSVFVALVVLLTSVPAVAESEGGVKPFLEPIGIDSFPDVEDARSHRNV